MDVLSLQGATLSTPVKGLFPSRVDMPMYMAGLIRSDVGFSGATGVSSLWQLVAIGQVLSEMLIFSLLIGF